MFRESSNRVLCNGRILVCFSCIYLAEERERDAGYDPIHIYSIYSIHPYIIREREKRKKGKKRKKKKEKKKRKISILDDIYIYIYIYITSS